MSELYRPQAHELWKKPKDLDREIRERYRDVGVEELREVIPGDLRESLEDAQETVEQALMEQFGIPEVPPQLQAEMKSVVRAIEAAARKNVFTDTPDDSIYEQLEHVAVKALLFKEQPQEIQIESIPERGYVAHYKDAEGGSHEYELSVEGEDMLFNMHEWAEQLTSVENVRQFEERLATLKKRAQAKPAAEQDAFVRREMVKKYVGFGFTEQQVGNLLLIADEGPISTELLPEDETANTQRYRVLKEVWNEYLTKEEKGTYIKFAAAMMGIGALEGMGPALMGKAIDSKEDLVAAAFVTGYLGLNVAAGWINRKLNIGFREHMNEIAERQGGLNERLAHDLAFQPGERMSRTEDRGRILAAMGRSQSAFQEILYSMARVNLPAAAMSTVGVGTMMAMDWRIGLISLASAPIAIGIARKADKKLRPLVGETYKKESELALEVEEQINAHQEVVLAGMQEEMAERIAGLVEDQNRLELERTRARADMEFQAGVVLNSSVLSAITMAGVIIRNMGIEHGGDIVAALMYSGQYRRGFDELMRSNTELIRSTAAIVEMEEVFNGYAQEEVELDRDRVGASELEHFGIDVQGVSLEIDGESILHDVSFQIPAGGVVRLEGRSGHGKTTVSRVLSGYYQPTEGTVTIGEEDAQHIKRTGPDSLYKHIAYLSQHPYIFDSGDLRENLAFGNPGSDDEGMEQVLRELGLEHRFSKTGSLDLSSSIRGLSGGEKARLGLARVLLKIRSQ
ncbi:hypothetical protein CO174_01180, partial [Candidatus Uhrbacteria bacterium CG_4_9_14_3_um_filter_50_9]